MNRSSRITPAEAKRTIATDGEPYQSLSVVAVVALVLAIVSLGALASPLFLVVGAAAIGASFLALAAIHKSDGALTGATLARLALGIALATVVATLTRGSVRDSLMQKQAAAATEHWFSLLAERRFSEARAMLTQQAKASLLPDPMRSATPLPPEEADKISLSSLRTDPLTVALSGQSVTVVESVTAPAFDGSRTVIAANYVIGGPGASHRHVQVHLVRAPDFERDRQPWRIEGWDAGEEHAAH